MLRAVLMNLPAAGLPARLQLETQFLTRLEKDLGGPSQAREAYEEWLKVKARPGILEVEQVARMVRWESTHAKAVCGVLGECSCDTTEAFFVLHLAKGPDGQALRA